MSSSGDAEPVTVTALNNGERIFVLIAFPVVGALLGWGVRALADWASGVDGLPFGQMTDLVASWNSPWSLVAIIAVGVVAGLAFALFAIHDDVKVTIGPGSLTLKRGDKSSTYQRAEIDALFIDAKHLVLLDRQTAELAREPFDAKADDLAAALRDRQYPWYEADPYTSAYRRWLDGAPELTQAENFVLRTREKALAEDDKDEAADIRNELTKLGLVVRDEGHRQYWRRAH